MKFDLHLHSTASDGNWSPSQMVAHAITIGMEVIALSDHDTTSGIDEAIAAAGGNLEVIPAVEINAVWTEDVTRDIHILGYFIDWNNTKLQVLFRKQLAAREAQAEEMVRRLREFGIEVSMQQIREIARDKPIGSVHITKAIVSAGGAIDVSEAYEKFFRPGAAIRAPRPSVSPQEAIDAIHNAGGLASIAHPSYSDDLTEIIVQLADCGLDAIEAYHRSHQPKHVAQHLQLATTLGLGVTGGSDCHGPFEDHESLMGTIEMPLHIVPDLKLRHRRLLPVN
ncbi:MAG: PHP domain-containing protein [Candidatus Obscuribacterales bacterium]|nr:PHP domain-containing protein [Candidatus Obscuribacterales bacterium]